MANMLQVLSPPPMQPFGAYDPGALADVPSAKPIYQPRRGMLGGMLSSLGNAFISGPNAGRNWRIVGAAARQLNTGGNDIDTLLAQLDQQRREYMQEAWQQQLQQHQLGDWKTQDQQEQAASAAADQAPESIRPLAQAMPAQYAQAAMTNALRPQMHLLTPQEVRAAGFQAGSVVQQNPQTGEYQVQQSPYHPPAAIIAGQGNTPDVIGYLADYIEQNGHPPVGAFNRNPMLSQQVTAELARRRAGGDQRADPSSVGYAGASYRANTSSLVQLRTQRTAILRAENAARRNINLAEQVTDRLARSGSPLANQWLLPGRNLMGDPDVNAAKIAMERALDEYARVITGAYGAGGTPVTQLENARQMLSTANTPEQIHRAFAVVRTEMDNVRQSFDDQENELRGSMGQSPNAPTSSPQSATQQQQPQRPPGVPATARWNGTMWVPG